MPDKHFRVEITPSAERDRQRVEQYAVKLETQSRPMLPLSSAVLLLKKLGYAARIFIENMAFGFAM